MNLGEVDYFLRECGYSNDFCAYCNHKLDIKNTPKVATVGFVPICEAHKRQAEIHADALDIQWRSVVKTYWLNLLPALVVDYFRILADDGAICKYCANLEYSYVYRAKHEWCDCEQPSITELVVEG